MCVLWYNAKPGLRIMTWTCTVDPRLWTWDLYLGCGLGLLTWIWIWNWTLDYWLGFGIGLWTSTLDLDSELWTLNSIYCISWLFIS